MIIIFKYLSEFGTILKLGFTQFVLVLSLVCNPMTVLATTALDTETSAMGDMPCQMEMQQFQIVDHDTKSKQANQTDCCDCRDCDASNMDQSCQNCADLQFVNAMLLETLEFCLSNTLLGNLEIFASCLPDRPTVPEIPPPLLFQRS